jgi:aldehyde oxidoreductase
VADGAALALDGGGAGGPKARGADRSGALPRRPALATPFRPRKVTIRRRQNSDAKGQGSPYAVYGYGAQIVELEVDTALGTVKLLKITAAHDVGRAINPMLARARSRAASRRASAWR